MSLVVDSSVWIDFFNGRVSGETNFLFNQLGHVDLIVPDLIALEVLQGFRNDRDFKKAADLFESCRKVHVLNWALALTAASYFRALTALGKKPRKTTDVIIATYCIENDYFLLHTDRDFRIFEEHFGLQSPTIPKRTV